MEQLFSVPFLISYAILYGVTMKVADLLNEHGLKWFKGSQIFFGVLWGIFGAVLVFSSPVVANIILAMNLAFIVRGRLDYFNHQLGASIIILAFLFYSPFELLLFAIFYAIFVLFGSIKDYIDDVLKKNGLFATINEAMLYYPIPTFIYCMLYGNWIVFWIFLFYTTAYNITKLVGKKYGYR